MYQLVNHHNKRRKIGKVCVIIVITAVLLVGCGKEVSVSFDSADGLTKKQIENSISEQTNNYGDDAQKQADEIYNSAKEKGISGYDSLMETTDNILQGKTKSIDFSKLAQNGLYYFLVIKQSLYDHFFSILVTWWMIVGLFAVFYRQRNKATEKAVITVFGFGVTIAIIVIILSPI